MQPSSLGATVAKQPPCFFDSCLVVASATMMHSILRTKKQVVYPPMDFFVPSAEL